MSKPLRLAADTPLSSPDEGLAATIAGWRRTARLYAPEAGKEFRDDDGDYENAVACAVMSAMFYAAALDAHTFGNLPDNRWGSVVTDEDADEDGEE